MNTIKKTIIAACLLISFSLGAQDIAPDYPEIGKPVPDFVLKNIQQYSQNEVTSENLNGKFVILDFWNSYCSPCLRSFPKINELHKRFQNELDIILVGGEIESLSGENAGDERVKSVYERFRKKLDLQLPAAFDTDLYLRFVPRGAPHLIWIDDKGIVQAITVDVDADQIQSFIAGQHFEFADYSYKAQNERAKFNKNYDRETPFLIDGNGGLSTGFLYRSLLANYEPGMPSQGLDNIERVSGESNPNRGRLEGIGTLNTLYKLAFFGQTFWTMKDLKNPQNKYNPFYLSNYNRIVYELKDESKFSFDYETGKNVYWYSLIVPSGKATPKHLTEVMQGDLRKYFGYNARVEIRELPYWRVTVMEKVKKNLLSKGGEFRFKTDNSYIDFQNVPFDNFFKLLFYIVEPHELPIIDETGIEANIDIKTEVLLSDFEDIKNALKKQGLIIEKAKKKFKVLVISD